MYFYATHQALTTLSRTARANGRSDDAKVRARWLDLYYRSGAHRDLHYNGDETCDRYGGLNSRDFDTCFEMGDGTDVLQALLQDADAELLTAITAAEGPTALARWQEAAANQATQPRLL